MPSVYPGALDTLGVVYVDGTISATTHKDVHNNANDAINKIEAELGIDPSGPFSTVKARLDANDVVSTNVQTASYTLVLADQNKIVEMNAAGATVITVPTNASVAFPVGTVIELFRYGAGTVTVAAAGGVTLLSPSSKVGLAVQYASATLRKRATNEWCLEGDLV